MFLVYVPVYHVFLAYVTEIELYEIQRDTHIVSSLSILGQLNKEGSATDLLYPMCISFLTILQNGNSKNVFSPTPSPHTTFVKCVSCCFFVKLFPL